MSVEDVLVLLYHKTKHQLPPSKFKLLVFIQLLPSKKFADWPITKSVVLNVGFPPPIVKSLPLPELSVKSPSNLYQATKLAGITSGSLSNSLTVIFEDSTGSVIVVVVTVVVPPPPETLDLITGW